MKKLILILLIATLTDVETMLSQCVPAALDDCYGVESPILCTLNELNGYSCTTPTIQNPTACLPCNGSGTPNNSQWWAFIAQGGSVTITINYSGCYIPGGGTASGLEFGIVRYCDCSGQVVCTKNCVGSSGTISSTVNLVACAHYYLWIDGCNGDVCNYTISISGNGSSPVISPLGPISQATPSPICKGCCTDFWVEPPSGTCMPSYRWTIDGGDIGSNSRANLCFTEEGQFQVCVFAYTGSESEICTQTPARCITVIVAKKLEQRAKSRLVCSELIPYKWHCETITASGTYRCPFQLNGCCEFDSVIDITFIERIDGPEIFYIGCPGEQYKDPTTKIIHLGCNNKKEITIPKSTKNNKCDSSYFLTSIYPSSTGKISIACKNGKTMLTAQIKQNTTLCGQTLDFSESFQWYKKATPMTVLSSSSEIEIFEKDNYCVTHILQYILGDQTKTCSFEYCEDIDEDQYLKIREIQGTEDSQSGSIEFYKIDFLDSITNKYLWRVEGGVILDSFPEKLDSIHVKWNSTGDTIGKICLHIENECTISNELCKLVKLRKITDREDFLSSKIQIIPNPNDGNFRMTVDQDLKIKNIQLFDEEGKEVKIKYHNTASFSYQVTIMNKVFGVYFLKLTTRQGIFYKKIIIKS